MNRRPLAEFFATEAGGATLLLVATVAALVWANVGGSTYDAFWHHHLAIGSGSWGIDESLQHWVNDGLMVVFFFLIGLEVKREVSVGELRDPRAAALPAMAAIGGMVMPALLFVLVAGGGDAGRGWGIPMATDVAFVIGVLALLGSRAPSSLKLFLLTLAIVDDIGAIVVIALFYAEGVEGAWLIAAAAGLVVIAGARRLGLSNPLAYVPIGVAIWYCTYRSGVHPTIAGVAVGLATPARPVRGRNVLEELEHRLHPLSSYVIVPLFALANAGVRLAGDDVRAAASSRITLAVIVGLVLGKTVGIFVTSSMAIATGVGRAPEGVRRRHLLGAGTLGGIGFTVALFIASLAYTDPALQADAKVGILAGSLLAGLLGSAVFSVRGAVAA